jgi:hypothetical protein
LSRFQELALSFEPKVRTKTPVESVASTVASIIPPPPLQSRSYPMRPIMLPAWMVERIEELADAVEWINGASGLVEDILYDNLTEGNPRDVGSFLIDSMDATSEEKERVSKRTVALGQRWRREGVKPPSSYQQPQIGPSSALDALAAKDASIVTLKLCPTVAKELKQRARLLGMRRPNLAAVMVEIGLHATNGKSNREGTKP